ncbi:hypothetical protein [Nitrososphaera viennensis]|uniref:Uncharacterized protein n=2 Tax=Nitrososphaera viennensis TaxID=1034015 RepID=A0A060HNQ0_9ARCH|nr:hypothetical protein [Nitrososphaera viennensis]AIC16775.1 hypothetical protein NVIE_2560 [Nitrososphaera viennensis EN76]UVS68680.1 hypothetical protein NWT39_12335 [Nitrososphaera viennensis]
MVSRKILDMMGIIPSKHGHHDIVLHASLDTVLTIVALVGID